MVFDANVVYVDRNANGDLTEDGERLEISRRIKIDDPKSMFREMWQFRAGDITDEQSGIKYTDLIIQHAVPNEQFVPVTPEDRRWKARFLKNPNWVAPNISITIGGKGRQNAGPVFAGRPQDAPVVHFNGPLTMTLWSEPVLRRGDDAMELYATLGTPGIGELSFAYAEHEGIPQSVHPVADIAFPAKGGNQAIRMRVLLKERC